MVTQTEQLERPRDRVGILGAPVDRVSMEDAVKILGGFIESRLPHVVVTADSSGLVEAQSDLEFAEILHQADLVTPDSTGVLWAAKRKALPIAERVSGVDLVDRLCAMSADKGFKLFFLGAAPGIAEMASERLRLRHPGCNVVGTRHGYFPQDSDELVAKEIAELKPDVLLVAMGIPRQEKFIWRTRHIIGAPVAMGVGGSFDVLSGRVRRAPKLLQRLSMEWLWRLAMNPKKWKKARALPRFVWLVLKGK